MPTGEGGSAGASSPPRRICAAGRTEPPALGRCRRQGRCCWRACVSLAGPDQHGFLQQCAAEAKHRRYFFGDGALLVGQAVLGDRRSQIVGLRCESEPTVVLRKRILARKFTINGEAAGRGRVVLQPHARDAMLHLCNRSTLVSSGSTNHVCCMIRAINIGVSAVFDARPCAPSLCQRACT